MNINSRGNLCKGENQVYMIKSLKPNHFSMASNSTKYSTCKWTLSFIVKSPLKLILLCLASLPVYVCWLSGIVNKNRDEKKTWQIYSCTYTKHTLCKTYTCTVIHTYIITVFPLCGFINVLTTTINNFAKYSWFT